MTSTDRLPAGVIGALLVNAVRLYEMKAAFGVVIDCVAFATTIEVMMATTVAMRMTPGRENFWIRIVIAFILFGFLLFWFFSVGFPICCFNQETNRSFFDAIRPSGRIALASRSTAAIVCPQRCRCKLFW